MPTTRMKRQPDAALIDSSGLLLLLTSTTLPRGERMHGPSVPPLTSSAIMSPTCMGHAPGKAPRR